MRRERGDNGDHNMVDRTEIDVVITSNDGVVDYSSAHIDNVESEYIVRTGHSAQGHPLTIEEVRRILLHHLNQ